MADRQEAARLADELAEMPGSPLFWSETTVVFKPWLLRKERDLIIAALRAYAGQHQRPAASAEQQSGSGEDCGSANEGSIPSGSAPSTAAQVPESASLGADSECNARPVLDPAPAVDPNPPEQVPVTQAGAEDAQLPSAGRASAVDRLPPVPARTMRDADRRLWVWEPCYAVLYHAARDNARELDACHARLDEAQREVAALRKKAVPEGCVAVPREPLVRLIEGITDKPGSYPTVPPAELLMQVQALLAAARGKP